MSVVFVAPLAAGLMTIRAGGLKGWQWLFIIEGIPSVLLGLVMLVSAHLGLHNHSGVAQTLQGWAF
jgi:MFS family permease